MQIKICKKCGKAKKKKVADNSCRLNGREISKIVFKWNQLFPQVEVKEVKCLGKCSSCPAMLIKGESKKIEKRLTLQKLKKVLGRIETDCHLEKLNQF